MNAVTDEIDRRLEMAALLEEIAIDEALRRPPAVSRVDEALARFRALFPFPSALEGKEVERVAR